VPIIEIWALPHGPAIDVPSALTTVTTDVAAFLHEEPRGTWAIFHPIGSGHFAEGDDAPATQPQQTHPALVRVFANRRPELVPSLLEAVGDAVVRAFDLSADNVVVRFEPADLTRMHWP
jgi:hypothetical protein